MIMLHRIVTSLMQAGCLGCLHGLPALVKASLHIRRARVKKNAEAKVYFSNMKIWDPKNIVEVAPECSLNSNLRWPGRQQLQKAAFQN